MRSQHYKTTDLTKLEDAIFWCSAPPSRQELSLRLRMPWFGELKSQLVRLECYEGPEGTPAECCELSENVLRSAYPIVMHLHLSTKSRDIAFIYIMTGAIELHLPEPFFVTGDKIEDNRRREEMFELAETLQEGLGIIWSNQQYGDQNHQELDLTKAWRQFGESLNARIEAEDI